MCKCSWSIANGIVSDQQMLKHGRAGVPMEVMGLMLGEFVDDYTVGPFSRSSRLSLRFGRSHVSTSSPCLKVVPP